MAAVSPALPSVLFEGNQSLHRLSGQVGCVVVPAMASLHALTDADLLKTYSHYQPDEPGEDSGSPIVGWITGNTYYHYDEHRVLIEALVRVKA